MESTCGKLIQQLMCSWDNIYSEVQIFRAENQVQIVYWVYSIILLCRFLVLLLTSIITLQSAQILFFLFQHFHAEKVGVYEISNVSESAVCGVHKHLTHPFHVSVSLEGNLWGRYAFDIICFLSLQHLGTKRWDIQQLEKNTELEIPRCTVEKAPFIQSWNSVSEPRVPECIVFIQSTLKTVLQKQSFSSDRVSKLQLTSE